MGILISHFLSAFKTKLHNEGYRVFVLLVREL